MTQQRVNVEAGSNEKQSAFEYKKISLNKLDLNNNIS